jgi:hypothetical protein
MHKNLIKKQAIKEGKRRFFDGVPCINGHVDEKYTVNSACVQCHRARLKQYRQGIQAKMESLKK